MRVYLASDEEALRWRRRLKEWASDGQLTPAQLKSLEADVESPLRRTNFFLRAVLFLFTLGVSAAGIELFFEFWRIRNETAVAILSAIAGVACYGAAEWLIARFRLYRHGIEEALLVMAVIFLSFALSHFVAPQLWRRDNHAIGFVWGFASLAALLIYRRFGYQYAALAAVVMAAYTCDVAMPSEALQRMLMAAVFIGGLVWTHWVRKNHRHDFLDAEYSVLEALLWAALYLTCNLQLTNWNQLTRWSMENPMISDLPRPFYWTTFALIWWVPAMVLRRGLQRRDRSILDIGIVLGSLTLVTNKPYLGLERHAWDPMLLGIFLTGLVLFTRRTLARGEGGIRFGFTAQRLSASNLKILHALGNASGLFMSQGALHGTTTPKPHFGGGHSGGGGASSSY